MDYALRLLNSEIMNMTGRLSAYESDGMDCRQLKADLSGMINAEKIIRRERDELLQSASGTTETGQ